MLRNANVRQAIDAWLHDAGLSGESLSRIELGHARRRMADYEEYLEGHVSLKQLEAKGIDTSMVRRAHSRRTTRTLKDGTEETVIDREIELVDPQAALRQLRRAIERTAGANETVEEVAEDATEQAARLRYLEHAIDQMRRD